MPQLPEPVLAYFHSVNDGQPDAFLAAFDENGYVLDNHQAIKGIEAIEKWSQSDVFGPNVRFEIIEKAELNGAFVVVASVDGDFDKTNLPDPLLLKHTFKLAGDKIKELHISLP